MRRSALLLLMLSPFTLLPAAAFEAGRWERRVEMSPDGQSWRPLGRPLPGCLAQALPQAQWEQALRQQLAANGCAADGVRLDGGAVSGVLRCPQGEISVQGQASDTSYRVQGVADVTASAQGQAMGRLRVHYRQSGRHVGPCQGDEPGGADGTR